jgi:flagellar biosynthesis/type III secretory pathway chaperone
LQGLVEKGRHPKDWEHYTRGLRGKIIDHEDEENWQAQEIAGLKSEVDELKMDLERANSHNNWLTNGAIAGGE